MICNDIPKPEEFDKYDEPRLHMERLLRVKLIEFDLSMRILIPLEKAGIKTLGDLISRSRDELLQIRSIGVGAVDTLEKFVTYQCLSFAEK